MSSLKIIIEDEKFNSLYQSFITIYNENREGLIDKINNSFNSIFGQGSEGSGGSQDSEGSQMLLYKLKVALETQFMREVKYNYKFILIATPAKVGCDLRELIYNYLTERERRILLENLSISSRYLVNNIFKCKIPHILTDIDDTLYPNASYFLQISGRDTSWINNEPYPGICKFYELFYKNLPVAEARYSTVLTASPMFLKESKLYDDRIIKILGPNFGFIQGSETKRDILDTLIKGMCHNWFYRMAPSAIKIGTEKFIKFRQFSRIFPEYRLFFIGDNGQGDLLAGKMMLKDNPECLVFIHNIVYQNKFLFSTDTINTHAEQFGGRLFFFKNYLELSFIFMNSLKIFSNTQYEEIKIALIRDIQNGLEKEAVSGKNLYEHYIGNIEEWQINETDIFNKNLKPKAKASHCYTRKNNHKKQL